MEKNIKMSLETAREHYKLLMKMEAPSMTVFEKVLLNMIINTFTKEELEGDEGYTWEKAYAGSEGYWIDGDSTIAFEPKKETIHKESKNIFKTEAQAKSALAFAQLSHIVAKYNEGKERLGGYWFIVNVGGEGIYVDVSYCFISNLYFHTKEDAETSLRVNRELWEQYHQL